MKKLNVLALIDKYMRMSMQAHMYMCNFVMPMMLSPEAMYDDYDYVKG